MVAHCCWGGEWETVESGMIAVVPRLLCTQCHWHSVGVGNRGPHPHARQEGGRQSPLLQQNTLSDSKWVLRVKEELKAFYGGFRYSSLGCNKFQASQGYRVKCCLRNIK